MLPTRFFQINSLRSPCCPRLALLPTCLCQDYVRTYMTRGRRLPKSSWYNSPHLQVLLVSSNFVPNTNGGTTSEHRVPESRFCRVPPPRSSHQTFNFGHQGEKAMFPLLTVVVSNDENEPSLFFDFKPVCDQWGYMHLEGRHFSSDNIKCKCENTHPFRLGQGVSIGRIHRPQIYDVEHVHMETYGVLRGFQIFIKLSPSSSSSSLSVETP